MSTEIVMPKLGMTMTEGTVEVWDKQVGETVKKGETVCTISSEKLTQDVESTNDGVVLKILVDEGSLAKVGEVLALVGEEGEETDKAQHVSSEMEVPVEAVVNRSAEEGVSEIDQAASAGMKSDVFEITETSDKSRQGVHSRSASKEIGRLFITPLAKKMAKEKGLDISQIHGTGGNGRITKYDVLTAVQGQAAFVSSGQKIAPQTQGTVGDGLSGMRKVIAQNMRRSLSQTAQLTLHRKVDAEKLMEFRSMLKKELADSGSYTQITITALLAKAVAQALKEDHRLNTRYDGQQLEQPKEVHIGIATALDEGLVVPVIQNADTKSIGKIADELKDLSERGRQGTLSADEMHGGTFSITNMGSSGVEYFTPILNYPEVGILGVGSLQKELKLDEAGNVKEHSVIPFSLSFDHQIIDGSVAGEFLITLARYIEHPYLLVL